MKTLYERQQKELAQQRLEELTAKLRKLGMNPDEMHHRSKY